MENKSRTIQDFIQSKTWFIPLLATLYYAEAVSWIMSFHEVWRDEMRALSIAVDAASFWDIFRIFREGSEGHPLLWPALLKIATFFIHEPVVLQILSLCVASCAMYVFFRYAPFNWWQKAVFALGYFPLYGYSVVSRPFGLAMLLVFLVCILYPKRFERVLMLAGVLCLLANTSAQGFVLAAAIFVAVGLEFGILWLHHPEKVDERLATRFILAFLIVCAGFGLALVTLWPTPESTILSSFKFYQAPIGHYLYLALTRPGDYFYPAFGLDVQGAVLLSFCIFAGVFYLLRKPYVLILFAAATLGLAVFFQWIYKGHLLHQGLFFILVVAVFWILLLESKPESGRWIRLTFWIVLLSQLPMGYLSVEQEMRLNYSSSRSFANWLERHPEYGTAILMGEPDYAMESLPFYSRHRIYIPREKRFGNYVRWTRANQKELTLHELLNTAKIIGKKYKTPVLIAMGHSLKDKERESISLGYGRKFKYTQAELDEFRVSTKKLASFKKSLTRENYSIYLYDPNQQDKESRSPR